MTTPAQRLQRAEELRLASRFDEAHRELVAAAAGPLTDHERCPVLHALVRIQRIRGRHDEADELLPALEAAADVSADPAGNRARARRLRRTPQTVPTEEPTDPADAAWLARYRVREGRLDDADRLLRPVPDGARGAQWHLAAGELALARCHTDPPTATPTEAAAHLEQAIGHTGPDTPLLLVRDAWRAYGRARRLETGAAPERAALRAFDLADEFDRETAARQSDEETQIAMRHGATDVVDTRLMAAAAVPGPASAAAAVVAMESARAPVLVERMMPRGRTVLRRLPAHGDTAGAVRWVARMAATLPPSQMVWMIHATADRVHHAFVGRDLVHHAVVVCDRDLLRRRIATLTTCWTNHATLERAAESGGFDDLLHDIGSLLGLSALVDLPLAGITRIAVVAGDELADVPFAAMPWPDDRDTLIGLRFALSELPCLSLRAPLRRRARRQRGRSSVLLSPQVAGRERLVRAEWLDGRTDLPPERSTKEGLRAALAGGTRQVRIDAHARFGGIEPYIALAPGADDGRLTPHELESMDLSRCGTLILGACETGMARAIGRDERMGFVRSAFLAGTSAVVAARWEAPDKIAAQILGSFQKHLLAHPRDVALHLAQTEQHEKRIELYRGRGPAPHAIWWALWTVYGDAGHQVRLPRARAGRGESS